MSLACDPWVIRALHRGAKMHTAPRRVRSNVTGPKCGSQFRALLQRGRKNVTSGDLYADDQCKLIGTETMQFESSMLRAMSGIDFEDKDYKLSLVRVNPRSTRSPTKVTRLLVDDAM